MNLCSDHEYRRASNHPEELDQWREWIRKNVESGPRGYVFEDADLVPWLLARRFWRISNPIGKFMLIERKIGNNKMNLAQIMTFGLLDYTTRKGDPLRERYMGFYLLNHPHENPWLCTYVNINGHKLTMDELGLFLKFELDIPPYEFPDYVKGEGGLT